MVSVKVLITLLYLAAVLLPARQIVAFLALSHLDAERSLWGRCLKPPLQTLACPVVTRMVVFGLHLVTSGFLDDNVSAFQN